MPPKSPHRQLACTFIALILCVCTFNSTPASADGHMKKQVDEIIIFVATCENFNCKNPIFVPTPMYYNQQCKNLRCFAFKMLFKPREKFVIVKKGRKRCAKKYSAKKSEVLCIKRSDFGKTYAKRKKKRYKKYAWRKRKKQRPYRKRRKKKAKVYTIKWDNFSD